MEDIAVVKEELTEKQQALEALQRNFDDFQESSRELEEELEAELGRVSLLYSHVEIATEGERDRQTELLLLCGIFLRVKPAAHSLVQQS